MQLPPLEPGVNHFNLFWKIYLNDERCFRHCSYLARA